MSSDNADPLEMLAQIRELHANDYDEGLWDWGRDPYENARATAERLIAAVEAVVKEADDADQQDRLISPDILRKRLTDKLTGADDEQ